MIRAGVHPKVIQELLGHSTIKMTMDTYGHLFPGMKREAVMKAPAVSKAKKTQESVVPAAPDSAAQDASAE
jgi:integrase